MALPRFGWKQICDGRHHLVGLLVHAAPVQMEGLTDAMSAEEIMKFYPNDGNFRVTFTNLCAEDPWTPWGLGAPCVADVP